MTRVLIADDEKAVRTALLLALGGEGYEVEAAPNGAAAMRAHERKPADVVITDLFMPERDGFEVITRFRERNPDVVIVAISGWERGQKADYLQAALSAGADLVLRKPFKVEVLLDQLQSLVARGAAQPKAPRP